MEKLRYLDFLNPIHMIWRKGTADDPYVDKTEILPVINQRIVLSEIPDKVYRVKIATLTEINYKKYSENSLKENEFYVDYPNGIVHFHSSKEAETLSLVYKGRGFILYPSSRIYHHDSETDVVVSLSEIIKDSTDRLLALGLVEDDLVKLGAELSNLIEENQLASDQLGVIIEKALRAVSLVENAYSTTQLIYQPYVQTYEDLFTQYPYPQTGWVVFIYDTGERYRWNGAEWIPIDILGGNIPLASEFIDGLLSSQDYIKLTEITDETHARVIVFVIPQEVLTGIQDPHIIFPFSGEIKNIIASVAKSGSADTAIRIEKSVDYNYWETITSTPIVIENGEHFDNKNYEISNKEVNTGDIFRLYIPYSSDVANLTLNIEINIRKEVLS